MKKAILYIRVSTDRQAEHGFSLPDQENKLRSYCRNNGIEVVAMFQDDYSAKDGFDRPGYNELRSFIQKNKGKVDGLLVTQWSRFSRHMMSSFVELHTLKAQGITVNAIEQPVDFTVPENLYMASIYFAAPQVENERLRLRTIAGMRQAMKSGQFVAKPPKGYIRNKETKIMEPDKHTSKIVKWVFEQYAKGVYSAEDVRLQASKKGLYLKKQAFLNMLANPVYIGKILVRAYKEEPKKLVHGLHEALIDEHTFYTVQDVLKGKRKPYKQPKNAVNEVLPLRGHLVCPNCGRTLTGSINQNRPNGSKIPYYHCQTNKYACNHRVNANNAHNIFGCYLQTLQPEEEVAELFTSVLTDIFKTNDGDKEAQKKAIEAQIKQIEGRIIKIEDDYADEKISPEGYARLAKRFEEEKNNLVMEHATIARVPADFKSYISYSTGLLQNLSEYYTTATPSTQHKLIGVIFPEKLKFFKNWYYTTKTNEVFSLIRKLEEDLKENSPAKIARLHSQAPPAGLEPATL